MSNHADGLRYLTTYGWHDPNREPFCERWSDRVPTTPKGWARVPKTCTCGFYDAVHHLLKENH